jgi:hypothetical protein
VSDTSITVVKENYGDAALQVNSRGNGCGASPSSSSGCNPITANLYDASQSDQIPTEAMLASL